MMSGESRTAYMLALAAGVATLAGASANAQQVEQPRDRVSVFVRSSEDLVPDAAAPERLRTLVRDLGSSELRVRTQADRAIADDAAITLSMIEQVLRDPAMQLSTDARERLLSSARQRFNTAPRGAMGVQFWMQSGLRDRVIIEATISGFPDAQAKLRPGDMVIEAGGLRTVGPLAQQVFQSVVVSRDPGDPVPLVIRRGEEKVDISVRLGRRDDLRGNAFLSPDAIDRAWRVRAGSLMGGDIPVIAPPPGQAINWGDPNQISSRAFRATLRQKGMADMIVCPELAGGGMPRGAEMIDEFSDPRFAALAGRGNAQLIRRGNQVVWLANGVILQQQQFDPFQGSTQPPMSLQEELDEATRASAMLRTVTAMNKQVRPNLPRPEVAIDGLPPAPTNDQKVRMYDMQIAAIRAEMREAGQPIREPKPELVIPDVHKGEAPPVQP